MTTRRSAEPDEPRVRLSAPPDILATIPFLVGYHPTDSVVVLGMRGRRLTFTARDDLPAAGAEVPEQQIAYLVDVLQRQACDAVLVVGFGDEERATPMVMALCSAFEDVGVSVKEALRAYGRTLHLVPVPEPGLLPTRRDALRPGGERGRGDMDARRAAWRGGTGRSTKRRSIPPLV